MVHFFFRKPKFPILIATDTVVVAAKNNHDIDKWANKECFKKKEYYQVIDGTSEGWSFYPENNMITPLTIDKKWTKKKIIDFYNHSLENTEGKEVYVVKSLSSKKLTTIIEEIACLAGKP